MTTLNAVCPYYTMFPLDFPLRVLARRGTTDKWVLDPFCGRGTTCFAARMLGLSAVGIDSSPVASAIAQAKLADASPSDVLVTARRILGRTATPGQIPSGEFWRYAFHSETLRQLAVLRESLLADCSTHSRVLLRAILLGGLHGPLTTNAPSYFSNQCTRTFAPKPAYAIRFWKARGLRPPRVDVLDVIGRRARRYLSDLPKSSKGTILNSDSRYWSSFGGREARFDWVITSPPYYGMRTYIPDQWLRNWFVGGPPDVDYSSEHQLVHTSFDVFADQLRKVWRNAARASRAGGRLVCRYGGIHDRSADPLELIRASLENSGWRVRTIRSAGTANDGRRQAEHFVRVQRAPRREYDVYAVRE